MAARKKPSRVRQAYKFMEEHRSEYSIQALCRALRVSRSGYYSWLIKPVSDRAADDARLRRLIRASLVASHGIYGAPRVLLDLRERGETCSGNWVARLMSEMDCTHSMGIVHATFRRSNHRH